jgi:hypothetical protein
MSGQHKDEASPKRPEGAEARRARLARELRANLLKRKAQARAREAARPSRDEGGQTTG